MPSAPLPSGPFDVEALVARHPIHPAFPALVALREADPDAPDQLASLLTRYPALAGRLVATGRSSELWRDRVGHTVQEGIELVGFRGVHLAAVLTCVIESMDRVTDSIDAVDFWHRHTLASMFALLLGGIRRDGTSDLAGTGALLLDVGRLALDQMEGGVLQRIEARIASGEAPLDAETAELGVRLADLTAYMIDRWGVPFELTRAVQETLDGTESTPLADNISTATRAADDALAERPLQDEIQRAMDFYFGSLAAVLTRVEALLASTMLR